MAKSIGRAALLALLLAALATARGEDWPTHMHDNQRTGVSRETLRPPLLLSWVFDSPSPPAEGWAMPVNGYGARKNKPNVSFDDAPRVIAVGDGCYFSSSGENRIYAIEASTGRIRWTYFTEAACRLAPAYWQGKLYVGADDGVMRCLQADDGRLLWRVCAAPRDDLMLGHGRFSSVWPIRAAGIVDDGTVCFTAGLFPQNHIYLYAVDAEEGTVARHRQIDRGGISDHVPQGYVLATDESLFTTSRTAPARWSKTDGARIDFNAPYPEVNDSHEYRFLCGGSDAQIWGGERIVFGCACILAYDPDKVLPDKWGRPHKGRLVFNWFNARQAVFADDMAYLATDHHVLAVRQSLLPEMADDECKEFEETYKRLRVAGYLDHLDEHERLVESHGKDHPKVRALETGPLKWGLTNWQQWQTASGAVFGRIRRRAAWMTPLKATESLVLAGSVLYAGGEDRVYALDASSGRELWSFPTESRVRGLTVANGRLYVGTIDGRVRCFAENPVGGEPITVSPLSRQSPYAGDQLDEALAQIAEEAAAEMEGCRGYCLILGGQDGALAARLAELTDLHIEMLQRDAQLAAEARSKLSAAGFYGSRVCVRQSSVSELPYPPYVFNLVIDEGSIRSGRLSVSLDEIFRVTKPVGGVALLGKPNEPSSSPYEKVGPPTVLSPGSNEDATFVLKGNLWKMVRGRIPGSKDWTHNYATAANTYSSGDPHVKGPFGVLWYGEPGPRKRIDRHAAPPVPLVVDGIMFTIGYDLVMAYDAYNGVRYWEREIPGATRENLPINTSNLAANRSNLFIVVGNRECLRLAARSGETIETYPTPAIGAEHGGWAWIAQDGDLLYGSLAEQDPVRRRPNPQKSKSVFALDVETGNLAWVHHGKSIDHDGIAVGGGKLFLVDCELSEAERRRALAESIDDSSAPEREPVDRRGNPIAPDVRKLVVLDSATGAPMWEKPMDLTDVTLDDVAVQDKCGVACMYHDGVVVVHGVGSLGHPHKEFLAGKFARRAFYALDAANGRLLWGGRMGYRKRPIIVAQTVYAEPFAWHLKTGEIKTIANPLSGRPQVLDFHRGYIGCGHVMASGAALFGARGGIGWCNLDDPSGFAPFAGMALACGLGAAAADGVFVIPEGRSGCTCDVPIHTSLALYPKPDETAWAIGFSGGRSETNSLPVKHVSVNLGGPAYRRDAEGNLWIPYPARVDGGLLGEWLPTYQHDDQMCFSLDELHTTIAGTETPWIFTSGYSHDKPLRFPMLESGSPPATYAVRLFFAEPEDVRPGHRRFSVYLQGKQVLRDFDVVEAAGGRRVAVVKEFKGVQVDSHLEIRLEPSTDTVCPLPVLCGFQARRD